MLNNQANKKIRQIWRVFLICKLPLASARLEQKNLYNLDLSYSIWLGGRPSLWQLDKGKFAD